MTIPVLGAVVLAMGGAHAAMAQGGERAHHDAFGPRGKAGALIKAVRDSTERYQEVAAAEADGYGLMFGCVSGPDQGAMGLHYLIYEPLANARSGWSAPTCSSSPLTGTRSTRKRRR